MQQKHPALIDPPIFLISPAFYRIRFILNFGFLL